MLLQTLPAGSLAISHWAQIQGAQYCPEPNSNWFDAWCPFDTLVSPACYFNAVGFHHLWGQIVLVEPWCAVNNAEPLDRTVWAYVSDNRFRYKASIQIGHHLFSRVKFLDCAPPQKQSIGDPVWDRIASTFAPTPLDASRAVTSSLRKLLLGWSFQGHLEIRKGGFVLHVAGLHPTPKGYQTLREWLPMVIEKSLKEQIDS